MIAAEEAKADKDREIERDRITSNRELEVANRELEEGRIAADEAKLRVRIEAKEKDRKRDVEMARIESDKESKLASEIELEELNHNFEMQQLDLTSQLGWQKQCLRLN